MTPEEAECIAALQEVERRGQDALEEEQLLELLEHDIFAAVEPHAVRVLRPAKQTKENFYQAIYRSVLLKEEHVLRQARQTMNTIIANPGFPIGWFREDIRYRPYAQAALGLNEGFLFSFAAMEPVVQGICAGFYHGGRLTMPTLNAGMLYTYGRVHEVRALILKHILPFYYPDGVPGGFPPVPSDIPEELTGAPMEKWARDLRVWFGQNKTPRKFPFDGDFYEGIVQYLSLNAESHEGFDESIMQHEIFGGDLDYFILAPLPWGDLMNLLGHHIAVARELARILGTDVPLHPLAKVL